MTRQKQQNYLISSSPLLSHGCNIWLLLHPRPNEILQKLDNFCCFWCFIKQWALRIIKLLKFLYWHVRLVLLLTTLSSVFYKIVPHVILVLIKLPLIDIHTEFSWRWVSVQFHLMSFNGKIGSCLLLCCCRKDVKHWPRLLSSRHVYISSYHIILNLHTTLENMQTTYISNKSKCVWRYRQVQHVYA